MRLADLMGGTQLGHQRRQNVLHLLLGNALQYVHDELLIGCGVFCTNVSDWWLLDGGLENENGIL